MDCVECHKITTQESFNYIIENGNNIYVCYTCVYNITKKLLPYETSELKRKKKIILNNLNRKYIKITA